MREWNYGYQRFDVSVMVATVVVLVILVQFIQYLGDKLANTHRFSALIVACIAMWALCIGSQIHFTPVPTTATIKVGIVGSESAQIMQVARHVAKEEYGINIDVIEFSDYVQPNTALNNGSIDANIFQHVPYLEAQASANHLNIVPLAKTFVYPMGFYSHKLKSIADLHMNAIIAIPNDPSNGGRALLLLQKAGLIKLKANASTLATVNDISNNPLHLQFKLLDAAQLPRVLDDADLVAVTNDFVGPAGLSIQQAVLKEGSDSLYANIIAVRANDKANPLMQKLIAIMHSKPVVDVTEQVFPNGAAIPAWQP